MLDGAFALVRDIEARGCLAVVVGGAVRDLHLGRPVTDVDLATDMPLAELASLFRTHAVGRSASFETVVTARGGHVYEITRFRGGAIPARGGAATAARERTVLLEDTAHRDFTINALVMLRDGAVLDLQGGLDDLRGRLVRCVGAARERFVEDPLRALRAVRFCACLGFGLEAGTAAALAPAAPLLAGVAAERIGGEVLKIASQPGAALAAAVALLQRHDMLALVLPGVGTGPDTLAALGWSASSEPAVNLALLLRGAAGAPAVDAFARRLRLPQQLRAAAGFAVEQLPAAAGFTALRRSQQHALLAAPHWGVLRALALADAAARGGAEDRQRLEAAFAAAEADTGARDAPALSGERIMALCGLAPGPRVGEIRRRVSDWALDNRVRDPARLEAEALRIAAEASDVRD